MELFTKLGDRAAEQVSGGLHEPPIETETVVNERSGKEFSAKASNALSKNKNIGEKAFPFPLQTDFNEWQHR